MNVFSVLNPAMSLTTLAVRITGHRSERAQSFMEINISSEILQLYYKIKW